MGSRVEVAFRKEAQRLIPRGGSVLAAVSGGGDSVALVHLLHRLSHSHRLELGLAHLDHGMRRGSRADRTFVERLAARLRLPVHAERREVPALRRKDESPEEAARRVRREFLLEVAARHGYRQVATGHTLDDQAETILMRLARGSGASGLAGMAAAGPWNYVRPLLGLERSELREFLQRNDLRWREDPSNGDLRFDRNRVRLRLLPVLENTLNPRAGRHLVHAARLLREDAALLDGLAGQQLADLSRRDRRGRLVLDAAGIAGLAAPIARRVARLALAQAGVDARRLSSRHVAALLDLADGGTGRNLDFPGGVSASREGGRLRIGR